jgi:hypothetical protein
MTEAKALIEDVSVVIALNVVAAASVAAAAVIAASAKAAAIAAVEKAKTRAPKTARLSLQLRSPRLPRLLQPEL